MWKCVCACMRACVMEERSMLLSSRYLMEEMLERQHRLSIQRLFEDKSKYSRLEAC